MTPEAALLELLARVGARDGAPALFSDHELSAWPGAAVAAMKSQGLLKKASPARSAICPGCERECAMPVHVISNKGHKTDAFIVCDRRSDINRVAVPLSLLEQWQASGDSIAAVLTHLLKLPVPGANGTDAARWDIGLLKGGKHSSHVALVADGTLSLSLAGHSIALAEVLTLDGASLQIDRQRLIRLADRPVAGAGDVESAAKRRERLRKRVESLKRSGVSAFLKTVAEEEGISVTRVKQLLQDDTRLADSNKARSGKRGLPRRPAKAKG